jgi:hypothetical protein
MPLIQPERRRTGIAGLGDVRHGVGDGVEDELDPAWRGWRPGISACPGRVAGEDADVPGDLPA